jgi:hypothetical protein
VKNEDQAAGSGCGWLAAAISSAFQAFVATLPELQR